MAARKKEACESFVRNSDVVLREEDPDGALLFNPDTNQIRVINTTGLFIWKHCDGKKDLPSIVTALKNAFDGVPEKEVDDQVKVFVDGMRANGFLGVSGRKIDGSLTAKAGNRKLPPPKSVSISITGKCNLKCNYCFYANEMEGLKDLPTAIWLKFFEQLAEIGIMDVSLTGGEALLRPDIFVLIDGIIANRMRYNILSNGTLINEKLLQNFEQGKRRLRLDYIQVSIDGSRAEIHNQSRPNSFDLAIRGLRLLKEAGFPVAVRTTINRANLHDLENIAKLLLEDIGLKSFGTNEAMPVGSGCRSDAEMALTSRQKMEAMAIIGRLLRKYPGRLNAQAGPQAKRKMYAEMVHARRTGEMAKRWTMGYLTSCGCVFSRIDILHDGSVVPCCMLPGLVLGNITSDPLLDIWYKHPIMAALRQRRSIPMSEVPGCEECEWNRYCNGSCPGLAHQLTGNFNRANPEDCFRNFLRETGASYELRT